MLPDGAVSGAMIAEFEFEFEDGTWYALARLDVGGCAGASGSTALAAIVACTEDIPAARERHKASAAHIERARMGTARCPGCGELRPKMTPEALKCGWFPYCEECRAE